MLAGCLTLRPLLAVCVSCWKAAAMAASRALTSASKRLTANCCAGGADEGSGAGELEGADGAGGAILRSCSPTA